MDINSTDRELSGILQQMKEELRDVDQELIQKEEDSEELEGDLEKLRESLGAIDQILAENLFKLGKSEESYKEISLFYEKLVDNTKNLCNYIGKQNAFLEGSSK